MLALLFPIIFIFSAFTSAAYTNATFAALVGDVQESPVLTYSVDASLSVATYSDDTTTSYVTNTVYSTKWLTITPNVVSTSVVSSGTIDSTATSTTTTVVYVTLESSAESALVVGGKNALNGFIAGSNSDSTMTNIAVYYSNDTVSACIPSTNYVTVTQSASPVVEYVTLSPEVLTKYVTVVSEVSISTDFVTVTV